MVFSVQRVAIVCKLFQLLERLHLGLNGSHAVRRRLWVAWRVLNLVQIQSVVEVECLVFSEVLLLDFVGAEHVNIDYLIAVRAPLL